MKKMKKLSFVLYVICVLLPWQAYANDFTIAVSIAPEIEFVQEVVGERAKIVCVIPEGGSPASYAPSPKELVGIREAKLYFTIGVFAEKLNILGMLPESLRVVPLHEEAAKKYPELSIGASRDPHIWLSPRRVMAMVQKIAEEVSGVDPEHGAEYYLNAQKYIEKLQKTDTEIKGMFTAGSRKIFIAFHPAFGYFADDYGLDMYALEKHGKEAGVKYLQELIDIAKKNNVKAIFYQKQTASRQVQAFAREIGGKAVMLNPLAKNYADNLLQLAKTMQENM